MLGKQIVELQNKSLNWQTNRWIAKHKANICYQVYQREQIKRCCDSNTWTFI